MNEIVGHFIFWCARRIKITIEDFNRLVKNEGINVPIERAKPAHAFFSAESEIKKRTKGRSWHFQKIKEEGFVRYYGIYDAKRTADWDDLELTQGATMEFNTKTGELFCDWPHKTFLFFKKMYEWYSNNVSYEDVQVWFRRVCYESHGVSMREGGILYFIPKPCEKVSMGLQTIFPAMSKKSWLAAVPQLKTPQMCRLVNRAVLTKINSEAKIYAPWLARKNKVFRFHDVDPRLDKFYRFLKTVEIYTELTGFDGTPFLPLINQLIELHNKERQKMIQLKKGKCYWYKGKKMTPAHLTEGYKGRYQHAE